MKNRNYYIKLLVLIFAIGIFSACEDLTDLNKNPNAINAEDGNVNLLMPSVLGPAAKNYLNLGIGNMAGAMQFIQQSGWAGGTNYFEWDNEGWESYYDILRTNALLIENANKNGLAFHEGVGLTMRAFLFGQIADYWGDAPYTMALQGNTGEIDYLYPEYDSQETIYSGIISDLETAVTLFASGDVTSVDGNADLYFSGDPEAWEKFANSLLIRYYVRISNKTSESQAAVEAIVAGGMYIKSASEDATMDYTGGSDDTWPLVYDSETSSTRNLSCSTIIDQLNVTNDPRKSVWFAPVAVKWVADTNIEGEASDMLADGVPTPILPDWIDYQGTEVEYTRLYNPNDVERNDSEYVGVPPGLLQADIHSFNGCENGAQGRHNYHVSMLNSIFMDGSPEPGDLLQARILSAAEMHFTLAEMALDGWNVGDAENHYNEGVRASLETWGVEDDYDAFITEVSFNGTKDQVLTQKWVASFCNATEAWNDYKRTGYPQFTLSDEIARAPYPALRFGYGSDELNNNTSNVNAAIERLETTEYSGLIGKNSVYSKTWLLQGTGEPY
ncbi:SusD/RagB family nutrient-binding outer membrane lipoprotein [Maribellus maritimus]|uniref:SusD/RagB family nutrient-binding outer membrane lipoprotein n=1 Tax=Maribellus maritimus TaxID=2870838 RepID=UPI001EEC94DB|nr:SusD/RagB family nutrient-binding outer membrane lipoprotein [Maribellus maritimus]MCG6188058.1 SusD/RagB family nutrient-binding outer membrane lipoprotein [Maribellus maritimus]